MFQCISELKLHSAVNHATWQLDGKVACVASNDGIVHLLDVNDGKSFA